MEAFLSSIRSKIICRQSVIKQLYALIGSSADPMPQSIFLYGHVATGKSLVIETLLKYLNYNFSIVSCIEQFKVKHMYEHILNDLCTISNSNDRITVDGKCDTILDFITQLKKIHQCDERPIVIVLDKCDRARNIDFAFLPALLRLRELSSINVCVILISDIVWEKFYSKIGMLEPIKIYSPQYTRDEVAEILLLYKQCNYDDAFYKNYLNLFLSVFFRFCRDLNELRYMAKVNFVKYIEPIEKAQLGKDNIAALWRNISTILKSNLEVIYLRVSTEDFIKNTPLSKAIESTTTLALGFELPFYAKYMLIAAFLASHNPAKEDRRLFMKQSLKKRKTVKNKSKSTSRLNCNPHSFPISRMLAIFCAILEEKIDLNANVLAQIPTMCQLGLLATVGDNNLDEPKYKCSVSYDFITVIAKTVGFNLKNYLCNFID